MKNKRKVWIHTFLFLLLTSCSFNDIEHLAQAGKLNKNIIHTKNFNLLSYIDNCATQRALVYIEGDGLSWINSFQVSSDPTPLDPVALKLLLADQRKITKIYLARPCQYINSTNCRAYFWTNGRYDQKVIDCYQEVLEQIKSKYNIRSFELIGYSGGAAIAALLAINRHDITMIRTFAGNIDHKAWTTYHHISDLKGSLDPMHYLKKLSQIRQIHYVGEKDDNITPKLVHNYGNRINNSKICKIYTIPNLDHYSNWDTFWNDNF